MRLLLLLLGLTLLAGCPSTGDDDDSSADDDDTADDDDATADDDDATADDDDSGDDDDSAAATASLSGVVTRSAACAEDCVAILRISILDTNPATTDPTPLWGLDLPDVDLSADDASVPFLIEGITPRAEPYYVSALFDDNGNADPDNPDADSGDLVVVEGFGVPTVVMDSAAEFTLDLDLNFAMF